MKPVRKLLIRAVLDRAVRYEERSYRYYERALQESTMESSFDTLKELMAEGLRYRMRLESALKRGEIDGLEQDTTLRQGSERQQEREKLAECGKWPRLDARSTGVLVLQTALKRSRCAAEYYRGMLERTGFRAVRSVFSALAESENRRYESVRAWLESMG